ncbi:sigma-54-dependent Fis family transcriptional regulator [Prolixibacteraceae bacterium JC049]|nr:sigma-54-dependent Fis family transcriptional regulator [Prolixibacteraceae bacterium JC049]
MKKGNILIVDDNKSVVSALEMLLLFEFKQINTTTNPNCLPTLIREKQPDIILLDMNFTTGVNNGNEGLYWLKRIKEINSDIAVIMITAYGDVELAVKAVQQGASDFILKPWDNHKLVATIQTVLQLKESKQKIKKLEAKEKVLKNALSPKRQHLLGNSPALIRVMNMVRKVAATDANVLITGENGTGKELIAQELHRLSLRKEEALVNVDMGAITETLFESELFGHVKGAYTDAHSDRAGKFEVAENGTLFLDEIGNLPLQLQAKLLAALQNRQITRVGSNQPIPVNIRLISATNCNLEQMVNEGIFREDLLYRINTIQIEVPPLRDRGDDIVILADFFLQKYAQKYGKSGLRINQAAQEKLLKYRWPGNVRELQHTIEKAVILSDGSVLKPNDFMFKAMHNEASGKFEGTLEDMEKTAISSALANSDGNLSATAEQLGITRQTLYNKIKKYDL